MNCGQQAGCLAQILACPGRSAAAKHRVRGTPAQQTDHAALKCGAVRHRIGQAQHRCPTMVRSLPRRNLHDSDAETVGEQGMSCFMEGDGPQLGG